ncbi:hypothetical protein [Natribaculum luteum]|uniref:hypothetical protein n=1 Tax=Natribaculum luteum TaxID=1586232 RepID=UPI001FF13D97|nr:hypothetical protein [Natribaculum luteum]
MGLGIDRTRSTEQQEPPAITGVRQQQREEVPRDDDEPSIRAEESQTYSPR